MTVERGAPAPQIVHLAEVGSTNDEALSRLRETRMPLWVRADVQTAGRGRRGRPWQSPGGNLYASFATALPQNLSEPAFCLLPLAAAVALAEAIAHTSTIAPQLKWPNDVLVDGAKTAGILLEAESGTERRVVIGLGVNVAHRPDLPGATHLAAHDPTLTAEALFAALQSTLAETLAVLFSPQGVTQIRAQWLQRAVGIGLPVTVRFDQFAKEGRFVGLDPSGRLILADDAGGTELVAAGDVFVRGPASPSGGASSRGSL